LLVFGPHYQSSESIVVSPKSLQAQDSTSSDANDDDTPSADDIADFASESDKDGDGEVDEPEEEEPDDVADQDEPDEPDEPDQNDDSDDAGDEDEYDDDDDGEETQGNEGEDMAHSGKNRDDIDGEASPEYRLSGYDRYRTEGELRRLGAREKLTPLIAREERMLLEY
jgi:hypothetical protein